MKRFVMAAVLAGTVGVSGLVWADEGHEGHEEAKASTQKLTGEVTDVVCYLSHDGKGAGHADCAKKCIESGLPVAIKVGDQLYLAAMDSHDSANKILAQKAGQQVTVEGTVYEKDGQKLIAISKIE